MTIKYNSSKQDLNHRHIMEQYENNSKWTIVCIIFVFLMCFIVPLKSLQYGNVSNIAKPRVNPLQQHIQNIKALKNMFKTQSDRTWKILKASTYHIITEGEEEPDRPAVIMMVLPNKESQPMALCLAQHFSHDINKILVCHSASAVTYPFINSSKFVSYETGEQKIKLDNSIQRIIKHHSSVIINHLEKLHSKTVMFFHGFCDTTEALNKRIAVIFLLETSYEITNESELTLYLENLWSDIDRIKIKPLLARIANNVVFLNQDKGFTNC